MALIIYVDFTFSELLKSVSEEKKKKEITFKNFSTYLAVRSATSMDIRISIKPIMLEENKWKSSSSGMKSVLILLIEHKLCTFTSN